MLFVLIGVGLLVRRTVSAAAITLASLLLVLFFGFSLRVALANASMGYVWVDPLITLALLGGVSLAVIPRDGSPSSSIDRVFQTATRFVPLALGAFPAYCGALHFPYANYVASLIPPWIPAHMFWTYFAAMALIAGGIGVLVANGSPCSDAVGNHALQLGLPGAHPSRNQYAHCQRNLTRGSGAPGQRRRVHAGRLIGNS